MLSNPRVLFIHHDVRSVLSDVEAFEDAVSLVIPSFDRSILEQFDSSIDVVILDWELETPDARGVVDAVRHRSPTTRILALVSDVPADDPIDRGADEYLVVPVSDSQLRLTVEQLVLVSAYEETMSEYFRLATERAILENELEAGVDVGDRYERVSRDIESCQRRAAELRQEFSRDGFDRALRRLLGE